MLTRPVHSPFGVQRNLHNGWGGWDRISKSFNFLYTLWVYRSCIPILKYILNKFHQLSYGFQILESSWRMGVIFSKLQFLKGFLWIIPKVRYNGVFFQNLISSSEVGVWFSKLKFPHDFFLNHAKSMELQLVIWSHFNYCGRSFDLYTLLSGSSAIYTREA